MILFHINSTMLIIHKWWVLTFEWVQHYWHLGRKGCRCCTLACSCFKTIFFALADKYSTLVSGEASEHVKQFISQEHSFDDYTQVIQDSHTLKPFCQIPLNPTPHPPVPRPLLLGPTHLSWVPTQFSWVPPTSPGSHPLLLGPCPLLLDPHPLFLSPCPLLLGAAHFSWVSAHFSWVPTLFSWVPTLFAWVPAHFSLVPAHFS